MRRPEPPNDRDNPPDHSKRSAAGGRSGSLRGWASLCSFAFLRLSGIADRQRLPHVPVRFTPVNDAATVLRIDPRVYWTVRCASVVDALGSDSCEDAIELVLADPKAVVLNGEGTLGLIEVEGQALVHVDRTEGAHAELRPGHTEEVGEQFGRRSSISARNYCVVEFNAHGRWVASMLTRRNSVTPNVQLSGVRPH